MSGGKENAAMNGKKKYFIEYDISLALIVKRMTDPIHSNQFICLYYELHGISSALFEHCFSFIKREGGKFEKIKHTLLQTIRNLILYQ